MRNLVAHSARPAGLGALAGLLFFLAYQGQLLDGLSFDLATALAPAPVATPAGEIALVTLDRGDLARYGTPDHRLPRRGELARLIDRLAAVRPRPSWIALDLHFRRAIGPEDALLAASMRQAGNVVIVLPPEDVQRIGAGDATGSENTPPSSPPREIELAASAMLSGEIQADPDGVVRRLQLTGAGNTAPENRLALGLALRQIGATTRPELRGDTLECRLPRPPPLCIPLLPDGSMLLRFARAPSHGPLFPAVSASDLLSAADPREFSDRLGGKLVLIGIVDPASPDRHVLPWRRFDFQADRTPGVLVLAQVVDNLLQRRLMTPMPAWALAVASMASGAAIAVLANRLTLGGGLVVLTGFWVATIFLGFTAFLQGHFFSYLDLCAAVTAVFALVVLARYARYGRGQAYLSQTLAQYVGTEMAGDLANSLELVRARGERRSLTVLFSDIRGFTTLAETLTPDQLFALLNEYLSEMTDVVTTSRGHLDKFIGDAVMAFWGARPPLDDHPKAACDAALRMAAALETLRNRWAEQKLPLLEIGIGINTGDMVVGNMGSDRRLNYTVLGDSVNLASRLEGLTKLYGVGVIVGEETARRVQDSLALRRLDRVRVKGRATPTTIFELMSDRKELPEELTACRMHFEVGLDAYFRQEWEEALGSFGNALKVRPNDGPTLLFLDRTMDLRRHPPEGAWDGVFTMKTK